MFIIYMKNLIKGIVYGMFSVCPGLSGGVLAIKLGDYNKIINVLSNKVFNTSNLSYLFNILIGFILGTIIFSNIINHIYSIYYSFFNIVVLLISIYLLTSIIVNSKMKSLNILMLIIIAIFIACVLTFFPDIRLKGKFLYLISGFIFSFSKLIPGLSSSAILINIGFYKYLLQFFSNPLIIFNNFCSWSIFWVSFTLSSLLIIKYVCNKGKTLNYFVIIIMLINVIMMFKH